MKKKNKEFLMIMVFVLCALVTHAQQTVLSGKVTDSTGDPIPGVTISVKGTTIGTITGVNGDYSLGVASDVKTLVFSFIGMKTQEVSISGKQTINVTMEDEMTGLDEVVVIGYGTQLKKDLTSSVSVLAVDEMQKMQAPQIGQLLAGRVAGVNISSVNSEPGAGLKIRIRGSNSINGDNDPLIVIDGVLGGDLASLDVNDIESMQVLKDASATAIYGSRGANGVIIVTTKQGKTGFVNVNFVSNVGFQQVHKRLDLFTAEDEIGILKENPDFDFPEDIDGIENPILSGKGTDWQDEIFQTSLYQNYHLAVRGGSERLKISLSADYLDQEGVIKMSDYSKGSVRANISLKVRDNFTIENRTSMYKSTSNRVRTNESFGSFGGPVTQTALLFSALVPVYAEDGSFNGPLRASTTRDNPVSLLHNLDDVYTKDYLQNTISSKWDIIEGLTHRFSATYTNITDLNKRYTGKVLLRSLNNGEGRINNTEYNGWQINNTLTYNKRFNEKHSLTALFGYEVSSSNRFNSNFTVSGFATEALTYNNLGIGSEVTRKGSSYSDNSLISYLSRFTYAYKSKYLFSVSGRSDGSSKFAMNNKWAFFPSGSFAWVASEEGFLAENSTISFLKFRSSYGVSGSQAISNYQSLASYATGRRYSLGDVQMTNGAFIQRVANPDLKWETTAQFNAGVDLGFFDGRLNFTADYFIKSTTDLLYDKRLPLYSGYTTQIQNIGEMENKGYEFMVDAAIIDNDFKWNLSANISFIKNKVISLGDDTEVFINPPSGSRGSGFKTSGILRVGEPIGNFYGFVADGIFKSEDDLAAIEQPGGVIGEVRYKDISGPDGVPDGKIDSNDKTIIGNALPDYMFGITNTMSYKGFDLNITVQGSVGRDVVWFDKRSIKTTDKLNYWTPETPDYDMPRRGDLGDQANSNYIEDASFLKFKNISLGYSLPKSAITGLGINSLRFYVSAVDAIVITKYSGFDPEVNSHHDNGSFKRNVALGYDSGAYPGVSQFLFGMNVTF